MNCQFPPIPEKAEAFQWMDGDAHRVGTKATDIDGAEIFHFRDMYRDDDTDWPAQSQVFLMRWSHTGELEWVEEARLKPYPSSPIPEPTK